MRTLVTIACLITTTFYASRASAGRFASLIAASALDTRAVPRPAPAPITGVCDNCGGTGKLGDGNIVRTCPECGGTGRKISKALLAGQQPTPWPGVAALLNVVRPQPDEIVYDPGCGSEARLLIAACRFFDVKRCVGVEIDPEAADRARKAVADAGLSDRIEIITGDSLVTDVKADVVVGYMWPEFWVAFGPRAVKYKRVASYEYNVSGLQTTVSKVQGGGTVFLWTRPPATTQVPVVKTTTQTVQLPRGSYCEVCHGYCRNPMAHVLQQQVVGYQTIPVAQAQAQPTAQPAQRFRTVTRKVCDGRGHCHYETVQVPY